MRAKTGAERYFDAQRKDPDYRAAYDEARERVRRTDELVRSLDACREARGLTKAELARQAGLPPEAVRRLFTMRSPNPTAGTLLRWRGRSVSMWSWCPRNARLGHRPVPVGSRNRRSERQLVEGIATAARSGAW